MEANNQDDIKSSRREFLKQLGVFAASSAILGSCEQPVRKAIPYLVQPEVIVPGKAVYYASTYASEGEYASILVKTRDGRPIKIEPNPWISDGGGATSAGTQASVLSLYDPDRLRNPRFRNNEISWEELDKLVEGKLVEINDAGRTIALIYPENVGPSALQAMNALTGRYPATRLFPYRSYPHQALCDAHKKGFGLASNVKYRFDRASLIVSFSSDFIGTGPSSAEYSSQYARGRDLRQETEKYSCHIQFETGLSLTGSNADLRIPLKPSLRKKVLVSLYNAIAQHRDNEEGQPLMSGNDFAWVALELIQNKKESIVISGANDPEEQLIVAGINDMLGNYGTTMHLSPLANNRYSDDRELTGLLENISRGNVGGIIYFKTDPFYSFPDWKDALESRQDILSLFIGSHPNTTAYYSDLIAPAHYFLESWGDMDRGDGTSLLTQPVIHPLFNTRQAEDILLSWSGYGDDFLNLLKMRWQREVIKEPDPDKFSQYWFESLQKGYFNGGIEYDLKQNAFNHNLVVSEWHDSSQDEDSYELELYRPVNLGDGTFSNNPWLQELPDPVSKVCWGNYAAISAAMADKLDLRDGDLIRIEDTVTVPVLIQPGQAEGTVSIALNYGQEHSGRISSGTGIDVNRLISFDEGLRRYSGRRVKIIRTGEKTALSRTQQYSAREGRPVARETSLEEFKSQKNEISGHRNDYASFYEQPHFRGHHWGMVVDLNLCTGCQACVIACQAENNIPVVGPAETRRNHEMHWLRIDRYYEGEGNDLKVLRQPVMCQHCDHAPCENVCPVAATNHSSEGLNQMIYNRCIGTRYCGNNCPYKVRRFNWYDYTGADAIKGNSKEVPGMSSALVRMVLNPDVTVRAKGVIEKCSFCSQRIQEARIKAKNENRGIRDGDVLPACAQACPAGAIVFGDLNDPGSAVSGLAKDNRRYHLLEELHTLPSVTYLSAVRNIPHQNG